jgi:hypothetical protein
METDSRRHPVSTTARVQELSGCLTGSSEAHRQHCTRTGSRLGDPHPMRAQKTQIRRRRRLLKKMPPSRHVDRHSRQPLPSKGLRSAHVFSDRCMRGRSLGGPRVSSELPAPVTCLPAISPQGSPRRVHALPRISSNTQESRAVPSLLWSSLVYPTLLQLRNPDGGMYTCGQASGLTRAY